MLTIEQVQERIDLTSDQKKAWSQLVRAINKCKKENIYFYQVLEKLSGLNGNNVSGIDNIEYTEYAANDDCPYSLQQLDYPTIDTDCSWADDTHIVLLK